MTLSSAVKSRKIEVIWNERARPSRLRVCIGSSVTSSPAKRTLPVSGSSWPVSCAIKVVLPAPFGPITACNSPRGTLSVIASLATMPPKRLERPSIWSIASATVHLFANRLEQTVDAAAGKQHDQEQQRAKDDLPVLASLRRVDRIEQPDRGADDGRQELLKQQERDRTEQWAE